MKIHFLGTSGHGPTLFRNLPATLIDDSILIDCGEGTVLTLKRLDIPLSKIHTVFLSHLHADHILGIVSFLWDLAFYSEIRRCPLIYVPEGMKTPFLQIFIDSFSPFKNVNFELNVKELPIAQKKITINSGEQQYDVEYHPTQHIPLCYAYKFNQQIIFSGDTRPFDSMNDFLSNLIHPSYLIHEASFPDSMESIAHRANHSIPMNAAYLANRNKIDYLYLYHLPDIPLNLEENFIKESKKVHSSIHLLHDNDIIEY